MFIAKDKSGTVLISVNKPERMMAHWRVLDNQYIVMNARYAATIFPDLKWEDEPKEIILNLN